MLSLAEKCPHREKDSQGTAANTATVRTKLDVEEGASAELLPQETILFDRAMVRRDLQVRLAIGATLIGLESIVLGRTEMGEMVQNVSLRDGCRIWRGGRLVHADALNLCGDVSELLTRAPTPQGQRTCKPDSYRSTGRDRVTQRPRIFGGYRLHFEDQRLEWNAVGATYRTQRRNPAARRSTSAEDHPWQTFPASRLANVKAGHESRCKRKR